MSMRTRCQIAYGIDANDDRLVVARATRRGIEIVANQEEPRATPELLATIESEVLSGRALTASALACNETVVRRLSAPIARMDRAAKIFPTLLDVQLPFPLEISSYVFTGVTPNAAGGIDAMGLVARREDVENFVGRLKATSGLDPILVDHEGLALWQQAKSEFGEAPVVGRVVVNLGTSHTSVVYGMGILPSGLHAARVDGVSASVVEISRRINGWLAAQSAIASGARAEWIFTGPGAVGQDRLDSFRNQLAMTGPTKAARDPATFLARALAMRALTEEESPCNFRSGDLAHPSGVRMQARGLSRTQLLAIAASLVLLAGNIGTQFYSRYRNDSIQSEIQKLAFELSGSPVPRGQETLIVRRELEKRAGQYAPLNGFVSAAASKMLGDVLALCRTNGAGVSQFKFSSESLHLSLIPSHAVGVAAVEQALRLSGWKIQSQKIGESVTLEGTRGKAK